MNSRPSSHVKKVSSLISISRWFSLLKNLISLRSYAPTITIVSAASQTYPQKNNRASKWGWYRQAQQCYTDDETKRMRAIQSHATVLNEKPNSLTDFDITENTKWYGLWSCTTPNSPIETNSFTLPSREAQNTKAFPLYQFAHQKAREIANWQADRAREQTNHHLINDPTMYVFEHLKKWCFNSLAFMECNNKTLDEIIKYQSYINSILPEVENFGPDKFHLHALQLSLNHAIDQCLQVIAHQELPALLDGVVRAGKTLEDYIGTILHFLVNQINADNFPTAVLEGDLSGCESSASPLCEIYQLAIKNQQNSAKSALTTPFSGTNRFYQVARINDANSSSYVINLPLDYIRTIQFASFADLHYKKTYLETIAILDALNKVRLTLHEFDKLQVQLGTYLFARHYRASANLLLQHYLSLINKAESLLNNLHDLSEQGLSAIYKDQHLLKNINHFFIKNFNILKTKIAKETTIKTQLRANCAHVTTSMHRYYQEMNSLAEKFSAGTASEDINRSMRELHGRINSLNRLLPALLDPSKQIIDYIDADTNPPLLTSNDTATYLSPSTPAGKECLAPISIKWEIQSSSTDAPIFIYHIEDTATGSFSLRFSGHLLAIKSDHLTNAPIYSYQYVDDDNREIGTADFYGQSGFCTDRLRTRHNLISSTGVLADFALGKSQHATTDICQRLPPNYSHKMLLTTGSSLMHGFLQGCAHVMQTKRNKRPSVAFALSQLFYLVMVFAIKWAYYLFQTDHAEIIGTSPWNKYQIATYRALWETSQIAIINGFFQLLFEAGRCLEQQHFPNTGSAIKKGSGYLRYGFFAYQVLGDSTNKLELMQATSLAATSIATGYVTQQATEKILRRIA